MMTEGVKLFRTWSSPFALRVVWALDLKGVDYETIFEDLSSKSASLLQYNPVHSKVPVLLHDGQPVVESLVILEYIEDAWKQSPNLLPRDPYQKSRARFWAKFADDKVLPSLWSAFMARGEEQESAASQAVENLKCLEEEIKGKRFFGGDEIGMADLALGCLANLASVLEEVSGQKLIDGDRFPSLVAWMHEFSESPVIKRSLPPRDKLIAKFQVILETYLSNSKQTS